ncbi:MAG: right-handed parallel beta-helix repeat-containing protein [Pirellulales bacterium]
MFDAVRQAGGGIVTIPSGTYLLPGKSPIALCDHTHIQATGAIFLLPERLGNQARVTLFAGENLQDFAWTGGEFRGHVFDPDAETNVGEPNVSTRMIVVTTTPGGTTRGLLFRDLRAYDVAGSIVGVFGASKAKSESDVETFAEDVTVENCVLLTSGKFMWDYGYLWQILVWPEDYAERHRRLADKYFPQELIRAVRVGADGDDRVMLENAQRPLPIAKTATARDALVFFGDALPKNIRRGKQYFIVTSEETFIRIAETPGGTPIRFDGAFGPQAKSIHDHFRAYQALYAPLGSGPGKGAVDLVACRDVRVSGCKLSARGDTMHIQKSRNIVFANNQILGSRMGAFFLAEYCRNAVVTGNTVDGTNGSRVMSVEKSCADVTIVGNTFRNGGRGSWINQPSNFILRGNVFVDNTTKCAPDPRRGRKTFLTGDYETYPELYFTLHQPQGEYDGVIVDGNIFETGAHGGPAIRFAEHGSRIVVTNNVFKGEHRTIDMPASNQIVRIEGNLGTE